MQHIHNRVRTTRRAIAEAGVSLSQRRRWFADDPNAGQAAGAGAQNGAGTSTDGSQNTDKFIPKDRFDEVNSKYRELLAQVEKDNAAATAAEQERLRKQGEFQQLFEAEKQKTGELAGKAARAEQLDKVITESNTRRIAQLPEAMRTLVPTALPPEQVASYLDANWTLLQGAAAPDTDAGAGAGAGSGKKPIALTAEQKATAKAMGMTDEAYAKQLQQMEDERGR